MKIAVYTIALNEQNFVKRWYKSAKEADYLLIADTDSTIAYAKNLGINVIKVGIKPWRFAGIGYTFDGVGFAAPQPYASWTLNTDSYLWEAPTPMPTDGKIYSWDEDATSWVEVPA